MESRKYSIFHLILKTRNILEISGERKGLSPFVVEYHIKMLNNEPIIKKLNLETPYIQSDFFSLNKGLIIDDINEFVRNFNLKENNMNYLNIKMIWKPVEYLAHQEPWLFQANIIQNEKKDTSLRIQGEMGQKKLKKFKKDIIINLDPIETFNDIIKEILKIIESKLKDFRPELLSWLIH